MIVKYFQIFKKKVIKVGGTQIDCNLALCHILLAHAMAAMALNMRAVSAIKEERVSLKNRYDLMIDLRIHIFHKEYHRLADAVGKQKKGVNSLWHYVNIKIAFYSKLLRNKIQVC